MTVENCIKLLEAYKKQAENPLGVDGSPLHGDERKHVIQQSQANYKNMKAHILSSRKFQGHPIIEELQDKPVKEKKETKSEVKKDGKKSKR